VAVGDFDGDGKQDLAVANTGSDNVSVLPGTGTGSFAAAVNLAAGSNPFSVAVGDFNNDGKQDLAVANAGSDNVSVLLNTTVLNPAGTFGTAQNLAAGSNPFSVAVGDFNNDGKKDLVVANFDSNINTVSVLLGTGTGSFAAAVNFVAGEDPRAVAVGDFDGDGKQDLAVADYVSGTVSVLLGTGTGSFAAPVSFAAGSNPYFVAVGDFNGDGKQDLAVVNYGSSSNNVSVLLGTGTGSFGAAVNFTAGSGPRAVAVGDFNGDGKQDLAVANYISSDVSVLLGTGGGSFGDAMNFTAGAEPYSVAVGDFNGDGKQDLAVANIDSNNVSVLLGTGTGSFGDAVNYATGLAPFSVAVGDFNNDGKQDLAVANFAGNSDSVSMLPGTGTGSFGTGAEFAVGSNPDSVAVGDFNNDGKQDLAVANYISNDVSVLLNQFVTTTVLTVPSSPPTYGQTVTFTATVTSGGQPVSVGTVTFLDGVTPISGALPLNGSGQASITVALRTLGSHTITASYSGTPAAAGSTGFTATTGAGSVSVNPAPVTPVISASNKVYDGTTAATLTSQTLSGVLPADLGSVSLTVSAASFDTKNVGTGNTVTATGLSLAGAAAGNYVLSSTTTTATADITARVLTLTAVANTKTYDGSTAAAAAPTVASLQGGDTVTGLTETYDTKDAGSGKTLTVAGYTVNDQNGGNNYTVVPVPNTAGVINKAPLTVTADDQSRLYGDADPALTAGYTGFVNAETLATSGVSGAPSLTSAATVASPVGPYTLTAAAGTLSANNYSFTLANGILTVNKSPLTVTPADSSREFGASNPAFTGTITGIRNGDAITATYTTSATSSSPVGTYPISATLADPTNKLGNYAVTLNTGTLTVTPASSNFSVAGFASPVTAGTAGTVTVTARDASGNPVTGYRGTVRFTSSDPQAVLPPDYTFTAADNGVHSFTIILKAAGARSISVTDMQLSSTTGSQTGITVNPAAASTLALNGFPSATTAGVSGNLTVTALDPYGNTATGYRGSVHFGSTDAQAALPANYAFKSNDNGVHVFSVTLKTAGTQSVTATDTVTGGITGSQTGIAVTPAAASGLLIQGLPTTATAGVAVSFTVRAVDAYNNTAPGYLGSVKFSSNDGQAVLPANYTFVASDNGVHTFSATLKTAGTDAVQVSDLANKKVAATQASLAINAAAAAQFILSGPAGQKAGNPFSLTVRVEDAFGNVVTGYRGTIHLSSTDTATGVVLPLDYTFTAADNGVHTFSGLILSTVGNQTITITDALNAIEASLIIKVH
jgi:hypothetical protein